MAEDEIRKEVQKRIVEIPKPSGEMTEEDLFSILKIISIGTNLRAALEGIVKTGKGALIIVENEFTDSILDGGFKINCKFTPQKLMELSKMDGAMVLSKDMKKIEYANVLLTPDSKIKTLETGTRHKAAERTAKMVGTIAIAVSERKNEINLYYKNLKHTLTNANELLRKASEHAQIIEKQRDLFDKYLENLNELELKNYPSTDYAIRCLQRSQFMQKTFREIQRYMVELGKDGAILRARLKELISEVEKESDLILKDYTRIDMKKSKILLKTLSYDELLDKENVLRALAYERPFSHRQVKGWRILSKTSLKEMEIAALIRQSETLGKAVNSPISSYRSILGEERSSLFKEEIEKIKLSINP